jgi:phage shock protein C
MSFRPGEAPEGPLRLWRDPENGMVAGVMAGIADYAGIRPWQARALALVGLMLFPPVTFLAYVAAAILLKPRPRDTHLSPEAEGFWRSMGRDPRGTFGTLRYRFREIDRRIAGIERTVTSADFKLRRDFRDLER